MIEKPRRQYRPRKPRPASGNSSHVKHQPKNNGRFFRTYGIIAYIFVSLTIGLFAYRSYDSFITKKNLEMGAAAYEIEMNFLSTLGYAESVLNYINRQISASSGSSQEIAQILASFNQAEQGYDSIKDVLSVGMFYWIDADKKLIASSAGIVENPIDLSSRDYLASAQEAPWVIHTGVPTVGAASGQYVIPAGVGVLNERGEYLGTSVVSFQMHNLSEKFRRIIKYYNSDFAVLDENDKVLMESVAGLFCNERNLTENLLQTGNETHRELISRVSPLDEKHSYIFVRHLEKYPYKILIGYKKNRLFGEIFFEILPHLIEFVIISVFFATILRIRRN